MKRKYIILGCLVLVVILVGGLILTLHISDSNILTGTTITSNSDIADICVGEGKYDWTNRYPDPEIAPNTKDTNRYYSNNGSDCIYNIEYKLIESDKGNYIEISYDQDFNTFDDLKVFFRLYTMDGNYTTYYTNIETSHVPIGRETIKVTNPAVCTGEYYIGNIWIRTED